MSDAAHTDRLGEYRSSFRFSRSERLKSRTLIRSLFDPQSVGYNSVSSGCVRINFRHLPGKGPTHAWIQIGLAVSRKCGNAVKRNRIKRIIREHYRLQARQILESKLTPGGLLIMMVMLRYAPGDEEKLRRDMSRAVEKLADCVGRPVRSSLSWKTRPSNKTKLSNTTTTSQETRLSNQTKPVQNE